MEIEDREIVQLELKYCERCGSLWLRPLGAPDVYCAACAVEILDLPAPPKKPSKPRLPVNHKVEVKPQLTELAAICGAGGNA
ncbi:MAG: hypothetical protein AUH86_07130 [Acidobacteria bacterium 13_1_40CM_4_58_4]|nr:MAG: hypothetical protein AUH86_07130 [Acidobacteria bacterium 13_1_40CM_4_58_4]